METRIIESPHPYADRMNVYTPVRVPGACALLISFDEMTSTEEDYDFVQFFKDASHDDTWGLEKYSGDGARGNWPGLGGRPPLEIPGDSFVFHFESDGTRNGWGYRARVRPIGPGAPAGGEYRQGAHTGEYRDVKARPPVRRSADGSALGVISIYCGEAGMPREGQSCEHPGGQCCECHWSCCGELSLGGPCLRATNSDGVRTFAKFDPVHAKRAVHFCSRVVGQSGYYAPCGRCDGRCGPNAGCQCKSCHEVDHVPTTPPSMRCSAAATRLRCVCVCSVMV